MPAADLVLVGGSVMTMDPATDAQAPTAVAVRAGRIEAVGDDRSIDAYAGPRTRRIELEGRTLLPGFTDAHVHPVLAGVELLRCGLHHLPASRDAYVDRIREYVGANPGLDWIIGSGWAMAAFPGGRPSREDLDAAVPDRPAFFQNRDGHGAWVNSRALELAGITRDTPDLADGRIERTPDGEPQGTLHEGAMALVERLLPAPGARGPAVSVRLARVGRRAFGRWQRLDGLDAERHAAGRGRRPAHRPRRRRREPFLPHESISLEAALRAYTMGGAWANHADDVTGSIEVGKLRDLVVLDRDIGREPAERLGDAHVVLTLIEGAPVFEDPSLAL